MIYRHFKQLTGVLILLLLLTLAACSQSTGSRETTPQCDGKCDTSGALTISSRWVPVGGFIRATISDGYQLQVEPRAGVTIDERRAHSIVTFDKQGFYKVIATRNGVANGEFTVRVSDGGTELTISDPKPGTFVTTSDGQTVQISGSVRDPLGSSLSLSVDGKPVQLDSEGTFSLNVEPEFGINFVQVVATDQAGNSFNTTVTFMAASRFTRDPARSQLTLSDTALSSLADKLKAILPSVILVPALDDPVDSTLGHDVYFNGATLPGQDGNPGSVSLALTASSGKLQVKFRSSGMTVARGYVERVIFSDKDFEGWLTNMGIDMTLTFVDTANGPYPRVEYLELFDEGFTYSVIGLPDWLTGLFKSIVRKRLKKILGEVLPKVLHSALSSVQQDIDMTVPIVGTELPLSVNYTLNDIVLKPGKLILDVSSGIRARTPVVDGLGAPFVSEGELNSQETGHPFAVALSYNQVNGFMFELWRAGAMKFAFDESHLAPALDAIPSLNVDLNPLIDVKVELGLPPVVEPGPPSSGNVRVSFGDARVTLHVATDLFQVTIGATVGARASFRLSAKDNALTIDPEVSEFHIDIEPRNFTGLNPEAVEALLRQLMPGLVAQIATRLEAFELPRLDLAPLGVPNVLLGVDEAEVKGTKSGLVISGGLNVFQRL